MFQPKQQQGSRLPVQLYDEGLHKEILCSDLVYTLSDLCNTDTQSILRFSTSSSAADLLRNLFSSSEPNVFRKQPLISIIFIHLIGF